MFKKWGPQSHTPKQSIKFDINMNDEELDDDLIEIPVDNYFVIPLKNRKQGVMIAIPKGMETQHNLKPGDVFWFYRLGGQLLITINNEPNVPKKNKRHRALSVEGKNNTLYCRIPSIFRKETYTHLELIKPKGFLRNEWQIRFLSIDSF